MVVRSDRRAGPSAQLVLGAIVGLLTDDRRPLLETGWRNGRRLLNLIADPHGELVTGHEHGAATLALALGGPAEEAAEAA